VYIYEYICNMLYLCVCVCVCVREREREREYVCMCVCVYVCVCVNIYTCVCVCVCQYIYVHICSTNCTKIPNMSCRAVCWHCSDSNDNTLAACISARDLAVSA